MWVVISNPESKYHRRIGLYDKAINIFIDNKHQIQFLDEANNERVLFSREEFNFLIPITVTYSDYGFDDFIEYEYKEE